MDRNSFLNRVCFEPNTGCWLWVGKLNFDGYGSLHAKNNEFHAYSAHRYSYQLFKGDLKGFQVLHICDVPCCVNPDHLFLGTHMDNMADMDRKKRRNHPFGERCPLTKLTAEKALEIKKLYSSGKFTQLEVAKKFGVDRSGVSAIVSGRTWRHVSGINDIKRPKKFQGGTRFKKIPPEHRQIIVEAINAGFSKPVIAKYYNVAYQSIGLVYKNYYQ